MVAQGSRRADAPEVPKETCHESHPGPPRDTCLPSAYCGDAAGDKTQGHPTKGLHSGQTPPHHVDVKGSQREGITRFPGASPHVSSRSFADSPICPFLPSAPHADHKPGSGTELAGGRWGLQPLQTEELQSDNLLSGKGRGSGFGPGATQAPASSCLDRVLVAGRHCWSRGRG